MTSPVQPIMSCERFNDTLADFLERDVTESVRAQMESHALMCKECGPLLADLRKLRINAANLEELAPSRDLWSGIAARIETPVVSIGMPEFDRQVVGPRRRTSIWIGLAAAGLVAATATATYQITRQSFVKQSAVIATRTQPATTTTAVLTSPPVDSTAPSATAKASPATATPATAAPAPTAATVTLANNKLSPAQTYDMEISRLRRVVDRRRGDLDSTTLAVLEKNLHIIDDAIAQCRKALQTDPSSSYLNESLTGALDNKVQLLRAAATLHTGL
jgi:hypothetical protein